jgi:hypothetical protein
MSEYELKPVMTIANYHDFDTLFGSLRQSGTISVLANIMPEDKAFFLEEGWSVAGSASNHFELGRHALKMQKVLNRPSDGIATACRPSSGDQKQ